MVALESSYGKPLSELAVLGNLMLFAGYDAANGIELWRSDGTESGAALLKNINGTAVDAIRFIFSHMSEWNGKAYFGAFDPLHGVEPWTSDGTAAGTMLLSDLNPAESSCLEFDANRDDRVTANEILLAIQDLASGCP